MVDFFIEYRAHRIGFYPILSCVVAGASTGWLKGASMLKSLEKLPDTPKTYSFRELFHRLDWMFGWLVFGAVSGLVKGCSSCVVCRVPGPGVLYKKMEERAMASVADKIDGNG